MEWIRKSIRRLLDLGIMLTIGRLSEFVASSSWGIPPRDGSPPLLLPRVEFSGRVDSTCSFLRTLGGLVCCTFLFRVLVPSTPAGLSRIFLGPGGRPGFLFATVPVSLIALVAGEVLASG